MRTDLIILIIIILIVFVYLNNKKENFRGEFSVPACESIQGCLEDYSGNILQIINLGDVKDTLNNMGPTSYECEKECIKFYKPVNVSPRCDTRDKDRDPYKYSYSGVSAPRLNLKSDPFNNLVVEKINEKKVPNDKFILVQAGFGDFDVMKAYRKGEKPKFTCKYPARQTWILFFKANGKIYRLENSDNTFDFTFTLTDNGKINTDHAMPGREKNRDIRYLSLIREDGEGNLKFEYYKNNTRIKILTKNGKEFEDMRFDLVLVN